MSELYGDVRPLVGRQKELTVLVRALERLGTGSAGVVELAGEPGIGKTRLLIELARRAECLGQVVLAGRATEFEREVPFGVVVEAVDDHIATLARDPDEWLGADYASLLAAVFPALAEQGATPAAVFEAERYQLHRALRVLLEELATPDGLVLILDDAHWADAASGELLAHLLRHPPQAPVLLAVAYRPRQLAARLAADLACAVREGLTERLELGPLTIEEANEFLGQQRSRSWRRALYQASGGNPFYLEALAATRRSVHPSLARGNGDTEIGEVPPVVAATLRAELDALPAAGRLVAQAAAVAGDPFEPELVAEVAGLREAEVLRVLDQLVGRDLVRQVGSSRRLCYRHPLVRHVAYNATGVGWRLAAHARAAAALAAQGAPIVAQAHHVERAAHSGDEQAIAVLVEAARTTMPRAPTTAAYWLRAALRLLPDVEQSAPRRLELLVALARAQGMAGQLHESRDTLHEVLRLLSREQAGCRAQAVAICAMTERLLGRHAEARALLLGELSALPQQDTPEAASLKVELAAGSLMGGVDTANRDLVQEALAAAQRHRDQLLYATALSALALADCTAGAIDQAIASVQKATALVDGLTDGELAVRLDIVVWVGWGEIYLEHYDQALRHLGRGLVLARTTGQGSALARLLTALSRGHGWLGRLPEAADYSDDALEAALLSGSDDLRTMALATQCQVASLTGNVEAALQAGNQAIEAASLVKGRWWGFAWVALAEARLAAGDAEGCIEAIAVTGGGPELPTIFAPTRPQVYGLLTRAALTLGHAEKAATWAARAYGAAAMLGLAGQTGFALLASAETLLARDPSRAAEHAVAAAAAFAKVSDRIDAGRAYLVAGIALDASAQHARALAELEHAEALFADCGAPNLYDQAVKEQQRSGRQVPRERRRAGEPRAPLALTARERQIAELVSKGHTNRQIARTLGVSSKTVETHLAHIFAKLGVSSRAAVASRVASADLRDGEQDEDG